MGNHEFCTECGESDFHYGTPCNEDTKKAYKGKSTTQIVLADKTITRQLDVYSAAYIGALEAELAFAKRIIREMDNSPNYEGSPCHQDGLCSELPRERWCLPCSVKKLFS